jgi:hypothetical protein
VHSVAADIAGAAGDQNRHSGVPRSRHAADVS